MSTEPATDAPPPPSKPAFLRRVRIRNYKSIAFCDVTLEPLTILVGRNATGKSNFLDALGFLRDVVVKGVREAVHLHGGRDAVLCRSAEVPRVTIEVEATYQGGDQSCDATFSVEIGIPADGPSVVVKETLGLLNQNRDLQPTYSVNDGLLTFHLGGNRAAQSSGYSVDKPYLNLNQSHKLYRHFYDGIEQFTAYNFSPDSMRPPQLPTPGTFLKPDGSNLASVYNSTLAVDPAAARRAARYLNAVAHSVEFAGVLSAGGYEILEFDTSGNVDEWNGPPRKADRFPAASMSDGTLRAFAAVMAAFQTVNPYGSPSLVAIEEPETALHPAAMRALVAAFDEATLRTQILITTHSPDLLDAEEVKPANVRVVEMVDGHTVVGPVDGASVTNVRDDLATLGELERGRQLGPDRDDLNRQAELAGRELSRS